MWEGNHNIEMTAYYDLPLVYLAMFYRGVSGDYRVRLLNSPSYEGDRDLETYPEYRDNIMGYINLAIEHAGNCKNLPLKRHFHKSASPYFIKVCAMYEEKAKLLKSAYMKRQLILNQDRCKDIGSDETVFAYCPEIDEAEQKLSILIILYLKKLRKYSTLFVIVLYKLLIKSLSPLASTLSGLKGGV